MSGELQLPEEILTVPATLAYWDEQTPDAPALIIPGKPAVTYAALWRGARGVAESLNRCGVRRDDRVVLLLPEGPTLTVALLGVMCAAIAVPLPASLPAPELKAALHNLGAAAALVDPGLAPDSRDCLEQRGMQMLALDGDIGSSLFAPKGHVTPQPRWPQPRDIALVCQTSGTTGQPKLVPRTQGSLISGGILGRDQFGLRPADRTPAIAPLTLSLGQTVLAQVIATGSALIYAPPADIGQQWEIVESERPTWLSVASGYLELLARCLAKRPARMAPSSLRFVLVTSAPIAPETCDAAADLLGAPIYPRYSSSEAGAIAAAPPGPGTKCTPGSVGRPVQEVRIVDGNGRALGPGGAGEIWVRGPRVIAGYLDDPAANAEVFLPEGWFRTGDLGYLDDEGFLFLTGRVNELINRGGEKIAPAEVDQVLLAHPAVSAAAAFAVPDRRLGQDIVAAVVLKSGYRTTRRELRRWMLDHLRPHKAPRRIWFLDALPLTLSGKVQRGVLASRFLALQPSVVRQSSVV